MKMEKIAVLIPCYNEELTIEKVIKDFKKELDEYLEKIQYDEKQIQDENIVKKY